MGLELVTGYWGMDHVTEEQEADKHAGMVGTGCYVLPIGEKCRAEAVTSNQIRIFDGTGFAYGRQFHIEEGAYENVTIENGAAGMLRNDFIVLKYKKDEATGVEGVTFAVLKGQSAETAVDPVPNNVDIRTGVFESEIPLYRIRLNGLAIEAVEPLFYVPITQAELSQKCVELERQLGEVNSKIFDTDWHSGSCTLMLEKGKVMSITLTDGSSYTFVRYSSGEITWIPIFVNAITACTISTNDSDGTIIITNTNGDNVRAVGICY